MGTSVIMNCGGGAAGPVKGLPFSAQEITEKRLIMPDGKISKESIVALITRDAEGRTRRDLPAMPPAPGQPPKPGLTMISDPIAGYLYLLHPDKTALRSRLPGGGQLPEHPALAKPTLPTAGASLPHPEPPQELGERMIEGYLAQGRRSTTIIPPVAGNPQQIRTMTETWCAKKLGAIVESGHSDPRVGETFTRLKGIQEVHPPGHLFQVPPDYHVIDAAQPKTPSLPSMPQMTAVPQVPSRSTLPSTPHMPSMPQTPSVPQMPSAPHLPSAPQMPSAPQLPSTQAPSTPKLPSVPKLPTIPRP